MFPCLCRLSFCSRAFFNTPRSPPRLQCPVPEPLSLYIQRRPTKRRSGAYVAIQPAARRPSLPTLLCPRSSTPDASFPSSSDPNLSLTPGRPRATLPLREPTLAVTTVLTSSLPFIDLHPRDHYRSRGDNDPYPTTTPLRNLSSTD